MPSKKQNERANEYIRKLDIKLKQALDLKAKSNTGGCQCGGNCGCKKQ
jgi:hypothetical protein